MRLWKTVVLVGAFLLTPMVGWAQTATQQLRDFIQHVQSAEGQFTQRTVDAQGQQRPAQTGDFSFKRPGKFKWHVTQPYEQLVIADGQTLLQYDPDLNQLSKRGMDQAIGASPAAILFGTGQLDEKFELTDLPRAEGVDWLRAKPKSAESGFDYVDIGFADAKPVYLVVLDGFGQQTRIELAQLKTNLALDLTTFQFTPPADVDVVTLP